MAQNPVTPILLGLAILFVALTLRDSLRSENRLAPRHAAWLRLALVFSIVAIGVHVLGLFFR
jgi:hypothetical protein